VHDVVGHRPSHLVHLEARPTLEDPDPDHPHPRESPEEQEEEIQGKKMIA
jgi:hypothetical protein